MTEESGRKSLIEKIMKLRSELALLEEEFLETADISPEEGIVLFLLKGQKQLMHIQLIGQSALNRSQIAGIVRRFRDSGYISLVRGQNGAIFTIELTVKGEIEARRIAELY